MLASSANTSATWTATPNTSHKTFIFGKKDNSYKNTVSPRRSDLHRGEHSHTTRCKYTRPFQYKIIKTMKNTQNSNFIYKILY